MTEDLIAFLRARLAEDEEHARVAADEYGDTWTAGFTKEDDWVRGSNGADVIDEPGAPTAFIAHHDPARVLREVSAKRRIADAYAEVSHHYKPNPEDWYEFADGRTVSLHDTVCTLAAVYADHPDFRPEWALTADQRNSNG